MCPYVYWLALLRVHLGGQLLIHLVGVEKVDECYRLVSQPLTTAQLRRDGLDLLMVRRATIHPARIVWLQTSGTQTAITQFFRMEWINKIHSGWLSWVEVRDDHVERKCRFAERSKPMHVVPM